VRRRADDPAVDVGSALRPHRLGHRARRLGADRVGVDVPAAEAGSGPGRLHRGRGRADGQEQIAVGEVVQGGQPGLLGAPAGARAASGRQPAHVVPGLDQGPAHRGTHLTRVEDRDPRHGGILPGVRSRLGQV
jgi:hypothetical protein